MKRLAAIALVVTLLSCSSEEPEGILKEEEFIEILVDVYLVDAYFIYQISQDDGDKDAQYGYYKDVFEKHEVTVDEFKKSYDYYSSDPKKFRDIISKTLNKVNAGQPGQH